MALIPCPECGKMISDKAHNCPNCGLPSEYFVKEINGVGPSKEETSTRNALLESLEGYEISFEGSINYYWNWKKCRD